MNSIDSTKILFRSTASNILLLNLLNHKKRINFLSFLEKNIERFGLLLNLIFFTKVSLNF